jgi:AraC-like DNA-binding protein
MGAVYAGVNEATGESAAIKVLAAHLSDNADFRERFASEVETLKKLRHPNIVHLLAWGEEGDLDGRDAVLAAGDFALYDSTRPYELLFDHAFEQIVLKLPGERLRSELHDTEALTATTVSGREGAGHLLLGMIRTLREDIDTLQPASALAVANGVQSILVAGLQTLPAARAPGLSNLTAYHLARVKRRIDEQLADPSLSVGSLAAELGVSASHIHRIFKSEPLTPSQYIWERRLEACSRDLLEPRLAGRPVADIAYGRGFNDAAHFSRAFRERFGCSPREWRQQRVQ